MAWVMCARARSSGQSDSRRLESNAMRVPCARALCMAASAVSQAEAEIASEMPDRCSQRLCPISAAQWLCKSLGCMRLAAEPARA